MSCAAFLAAPVLFQEAKRPVRVGLLGAAVC